MVLFSPSIDVLLFSLGIAVFINTFYKLLINQSESKFSRERIKELNDQIKKANKEGNTKKMDELFKEVMSENSKVMRMSFKPMLISFAVILVALPWMGGMYGEKQADANGQFQLNGDSYTVQTNENTVTIDGKTCTMPCSLEAGKTTVSIEMKDNKLKITPTVAELPFTAPFVGKDLGWLGWYFLSSIFFMIVTRKLMKIYM